MSRTGSSLLAVCLLGVVVAGCISGVDDQDQDEDIWKIRGYDPWTASFENTKPATSSALQPLTRLLDHSEEPWPVGHGNWVQGDLVFSSAGWHSFYIADISDPENPRIIYAPEDPEASETPYARKAEVVNHPDGRMTLALATQWEGMHLWDVTDPENPVWASSIDFDPEPNHYVSIVPGMEVVMNNPSRGEGSTNHFVDVSDPYNPVLLGEFSEVGCHGTVFLNEFGHDRFRAYCAGIDRTEIWDMTGWDPEAPDLGIKILGVVDELNDPVAGNPLLNQAPVRSLHHLATANEDGTILIIGDEHNGGGSPGACFFHEEGQSTPLGALWFYDISDESDPQLLSWLSPPTVPPRAPSDLPSGEPTDPNTWLRFVYGTVPNCTAHFGEVIEGENKMVIAWYSAGVLLVDFEDPENPVILDQFQPEGTNVWSARYHNGYVFTSDINRGMDVLRIV
jgi:hypothetical protein